MIRALNDILPTLWYVRSMIYYQLYDTSAQWYTTNSMIRALNDILPTLWYVRSMIYYQLCDKGRCAWESLRITCYAMSDRNGMNRLSWLWGVEFRVCHTTANLLSAKYRFAVHQWFINHGLVVTRTFQLFDVAMVCTGHAARIILTAMFNGFFLSHHSPIFDRVVIRKAR